MIQRIQSLLLLGVALVSIALFFVPFSEKAAASEAGSGTLYELTIKGVTTTGTGSEGPGTTTYVLLIVNLLILALSAYTIFMYRNRSIQVRLCMFGGLLTTVFLVLIFYYSENMGPETIR